MTCAGVQLLLFAVLSLVAFGYDRYAVSSWNCTTFVNETLARNDSGIRWWQGNCSGTTEFGAVGPITVNLVKAALGNPRVFLTTLTANTTFKVEPLLDMMRQDERLVAGINGGYFYRVDTPNFFDNVCFGKTLEEAEQNVSSLHPNRGVGDGVLVKDGVLVASNCDAIYGYNRPATLVLNGTQSHIVVQHTADPPPTGARNALAAGPNLVSVDSNGTTFVGIPSDDENVNIFEHSANTAVGLLGRPGAADALVMVTFNGADGCNIFDPTCGISSLPLAFFMKDWVGTFEAMNMDQGGSTTMTVEGHGLVSCSSWPHCDLEGRQLFSGLFVGLDE